MITQNSDFKGKYAIANAQDAEPGSDLVGNTEALAYAIETYEPRCLVTVLGFELYKELLPELSKQPWVPGSPDVADQKWIDLVEGNGQYEGLRPIIIPYVYFYFLQEDESHHSGVGVIKERAKGAEYHPSEYKARLAWRDFFNRTMGPVVYPNIITKNATPGTITGILYPNVDDKFHHLYKFLEDNATTYPNATMSIIKNLQSHGI